MNHRAFNASSAVLLAIAFGACAGATSPVAPTTTTDGSTPPSASVAVDASSPPSAGAVATATPTLDPAGLKAAAAKAYLAAVNPANKANDALFKKYKNVTSLAGNRTYCAKLAAVEHTELLALQAIAYPADTAADARLLIRAAAAVEADMRSCAKATNWASWNNSWNLGGKAGDRAHEAANLVRLDLGLPSVPG